jgi:hypothetical protein
MAQDEASAPSNVEAPAPGCVCGLLVVTALTKGGHPHWAIGGMISVYMLYLAVRYARHGAPALGASASNMPNVWISAVGLTTAAAIAATMALMSGGASSRLEHFSKADVEVAQSTALVNRRFAMSPRQIERCLLDEQKDDSMGFTDARLPDLSQEDLRCPIRILAGDVWTFNEKALERF